MVDIVAAPRRILGVSAQHDQEHLRRVIHELTGTQPSSAASPSTTSTLAGSSHDLHLQTRYYTATVPIWLDLITSPEEWTASFLSDEAVEVLSVLGGLFLVFAIPNSSNSDPDLQAGDAPAARELIQHVGRVVQQGLGGWEWDGVRLAIGVGDGEPDEWDELCAEAGMEFVQIDGRPALQQEFGEKTGISRIKEALEANDWSQPDIPQLPESSDVSEKADDDHDLDPDSLDFGIDQTDMEELRRSLWGSGNANDADMRNSDGTVAAAEAATDNTAAINVDDEDVVKVERMMRKLQAAREAGQTVGEAQRRRMAAQAVKDVMREL